MPTSHCLICGSDPYPKNHHQVVNDSAMGGFSSLRWSSNWFVGWDLGEWGESLGAAKAKAGCETHLGIFQGSPTFLNSTASCWLIRCLKGDQPSWTMVDDTDEPWSASAINSHSGTTDQGCPEPSWCSLGISLRYHPILVRRLPWSSNQKFPQQMQLGTGWFNLFTNWRSWAWGNNMFLGGLEPKVRYFTICGVLKL